MGKLQDWVDEEWVRIDSSGNIAGACGTSKNKKNPDRCLPRSKAQSLSQSERAATARKKKREGAKGKQVVANTSKARVVRKRKGGVIARGCGSILGDRRKVTKGSVERV